MSKQCVTHHFACDCREEKFKELERENKQLRQTVLETLNQRGQRELIVAWDRAKELERENAALRAERVLVSVHTGKFTTISGRAMICPDCGMALLHEDRASIDAARKGVQP